MVEMCELSVEVYMVDTLDTLDTLVTVVTVVQVQVVQVVLEEDTVAHMIVLVSPLEWVLVGEEDMVLVASLC